jgi:hypothetical protein
MAMVERVFDEIRRARHPREQRRDRRTHHRIEERSTEEFDTSRRTWRDLSGCAARRCRG